MDGGLTSDLRGRFFFEYPEALLVMTLEGALVDTNAAARLALGGDLDASFDFGERVHAEDREKLDAALRRSREGGRVMEDSIRILGADGVYHPMMFEIRRAARDAYLFVSFSPTKQKKQKMRDAQLLRALIDNLDIIVWATDQKGVFTYHDGLGLRKTGVDPTVFVGKNAFDIYPAETMVGLRDCLQGKSVRTITEDTTGAFYENWYVPVREAEEGVTGVIGMSIDVTATHKAQRDLEQKLEIIERQQEVIRNLETPILQVWDGIIALPLVGVIDSSRSARVMDDLLAAVARTQARFALLDLTGVEVVDTSTANHIIGMIRAIGLLGAAGVVTGIRPNVAQTIISLGMDLSKLTTLANLRQGLSYCLQRMNGTSKRGLEALSR